jgi:hypothetical protein
MWSFLILMLLFALEDHVSMSLLRIADSWIRGFWNMLFQIFPRAGALMLARPLLWASFESTLQEYLPPALTRLIWSAYAFVCHLPQGKNPVEKRLVVVTGSEAELYIDEIDAEFMHTVGGQEDGSGAGVVAQVGLTGARGTEIRRVSQQKMNSLGCTVNRRKHKGM